jgi:hypothetical protein
VGKAAEEVAGSIGKAAAAVAVGSMGKGAAAVAVGSMGKGAAAGFSSYKFAGMYLLKIDAILPTLCTSAGAPVVFALLSSEEKML